jgi:hypothetical protein
VNDLKNNGFLNNYSMKATGEQVYEKIVIIKLFVSNYERDLWIKMVNTTPKNVQ